MRNSVLKKILGVTDFIGRFDTVISAVSMFAIVCISIWGVIARYVLGDPAGWVEELSLGLFVWLTFFGISVLARRGEIVVIEFLLSFFPEKLSFFIKKILLSIFAAISLGIIIWFGFQLTFFSFDRYTAILRIPLSVVYIGIPLGSIFTLYHILRCTISGPKYFEQLIDDELIS